MEATKKELIIDTVLAHIKECAGLDVKHDDYFDAIQGHKGKPYFSIKLKGKISEDVATYGILRSITGEGRMIESIEPNGVRRVAVFFNKDLLGE